MDEQLLWRKRAYERGLKRDRSEYRKTGKYRAMKKRGRKKYKLANRPKVLAEKKLARAIKSGKVKRPRGCVSHHWDYNRPFDVRWMREQDHKRLHVWIRMYREMYLSL